MKTQTSTLSKTLATGLSLVMFVTNGALAHSTESNFWAERKKTQVASLPINMGQLNPSQILSQLPLSRMSSLKSSLPRKIEKSLSPTALKKYAPIFHSLPTSYGSIKNISFPTNGATGRTVIHIQDVHMQSEAQENIGKSLQELINGSQIDLVALEGAFDPIDLTPFRAPKYQAAVKMVSDYLLKINKISGAIHTAFTSTKNIPPIIGVDDSKHYLANVQAYKDSSLLKKATKDRLSNEEKRVASEKSKAFNPTLLVFDGRVQAYRSNKLDLGGYLKLLSKTQSHLSLSVEAFLEALSMESKLNFSKVESERNQLISQLVSKLTKQETSQLVDQSVAYRLGNIRHSDFYDHLKAVCRSHGVELVRYREMNSYIQYVLLSETLDADLILAEVNKMERDVFAALIKSPVEKKLTEESQELFLIGKLLDFSLSSEEWKEYQKLALRSPVGDLKSFEAFYEEANQRDQAIASNLMKAMDQQKASVAVLVTGGFHSAGINKQMQNAGITTITFCPKISKVTDESGVSYLSVFTQEKTPLDKLFEGQKLFLPTSPVINPAVMAVSVAGAKSILEESPAGFSAAVDELGGKSDISTITPGHDEALIQMIGENGKGDLTLKSSGKELTNMELKVHKASLFSDLEKAVMAFLQYVKGYFTRANERRSNRSTSKRKSGVESLEPRFALNGDNFIPFDVANTNQVGDVGSIIWNSNQSEGEDPAASQQWVSQDSGHTLKAFLRPTTHHPIYSGYPYQVYDQLVIQNQLTGAEEQYSFSEYYSPAIYDVQFTPDLQRVIVLNSRANGYNTVTELRVINRMTGNSVKLEKTFDVHDVDQVPYVTNDGFLVTHRLSSVQGPNSESYRFAGDTVGKFLPKLGGDMMLLVKEIVPAQPSGPDFLSREEHIVESVVRVNPSKVISTPINRVSLYPFGNPTRDRVSSVIDSPAGKFLGVLSTFDSRSPYSSITDTHNFDVIDNKGDVIVDVRASLGPIKISNINKENPRAAFAPNISLTDNSLTVTYRPVLYISKSYQTLLGQERTHVFYFGTPNYHRDILDVNGDTYVSPLDVLNLINKIKTDGAGPSVNGSQAPFFDVNGDDQLNPLDVLQTINFLNLDQGGSEESLINNSNAQDVGRTAEGEGSDTFLKASPDGTIGIYSRGPNAVVIKSLPTQAELAVIFLNEGSQPSSILQVEITRDSNRVVIRYRNNEDDKIVVSDRYGADPQFLSLYDFVGEVQVLELRDSYVKLGYKTRSISGQEILVSEESRFYFYSGVSKELTRSQDGRYLALLSKKLIEKQGVVYVQESLTLVDTVTGVITSKPVNAIALSDPRSTIDHMINTQFSNDNTLLVVSASDDIGSLGILVGNFHEIVIFAPSGMETLFDSNVAIRDAFQLAEPYSDIQFSHEDVVFDAYPMPYDFEADTRQLGEKTQFRFSLPYSQSYSRLDVDGDGHISPLDVLTIINYLNRRIGGSQPVGSRNPLDVDMDRFISPLDVLNVINHINSQSNGYPTGEQSRIVAEGEDPMDVFIQASPDGTIGIYIRGSNFIVVKNLQTQNELTVIPLDEGFQVSSIRFSPDGKYFGVLTNKLGNTNNYHVYKIGSKVSFLNVRDALQAEMPMSMRNPISLTISEIPRLDENGNVDVRVIVHATDALSGAQSLKEEVVRFSTSGKFSSPYDTDGDGDLTPMDVLRVINWLNLSPRPDSVVNRPLDVDGDGGVSPLDVLAMINEINSRSTGSSGVVTNPDELGKIIEAQKQAALDTYYALLTTIDLQHFQNTVYVYGFYKWLVSLSNVPNFILSSASSAGSRFEIRYGGSVGKLQLHKFSSGPGGEFTSQVISVNRGTGVITVWTKEGGEITVAPNQPKYREHFDALQSYISDLKTKFNKDPARLASANLANSFLDSARYPFPTNVAFKTTVNKNAVEALFSEGYFDFSYGPSKTSYDLRKGQTPVIRSSRPSSLFHHLWTLFFLPNKLETHIAQWLAMLEIPAIVLVSQFVGPSSGLGVAVILIALHLVTAPFSRDPVLSRRWRLSSIQHIVLLLSPALIGWISPDLTILSAAILMTGQFRLDYSFFSNSRKRIEYLDQVAADMARAYGDTSAIERLIRVDNLQVSDIAQPKKDISAANYPTLSSREKGYVASKLADILKIQTGRVPISLARSRFVGLHAMGKTYKPVAKIIPGGNLATDWRLNSEADIPAFLASVDKALPTLQPEKKLILQRPTQDLLDILKKKMSRVHFERLAFVKGEFYSNGVFQVEAFLEAAANDGHKDMFMAVEGAYYISNEAQDRLTKAGTLKNIVLLMEWLNGLLGFEMSNNLKIEDIDKVARPATFA